MLPNGGGSHKKSKDLDREVDSKHGASLSSCSILAAHLIFGWSMEDIVNVLSLTSDKKNTDFVEEREAVDTCLRLCVGGNKMEGSRQR